MLKITNNAGVPLTLAVWAVNDSYDYVNDPKYFSVTTLLKPVRQIILSKRVDPNTDSQDVEDYLATAMGTSIHDSIEKAWTQNYKKNLERLGYPESLVNRFKINPQDPLEKDDIPIYLEQRTIREYRGYKIGGKFDFVADGLLHDNKSTTTMKWTKGSSDKDYMLQGSLYRWLNPDKIIDDFIRINFVFTDWSKLNAMKDPSYPQHRAMYKDIPLMSLEKTEEWLDQKLKLIEKYWNASQDQIPECTDEELWRTPTKYKYFSNPNATRATKNFDSLAEVKQYWLVDKQGKGCIKIFPGEVRRCKYCFAASICNQYAKEWKDGS